MVEKIKNLKQKIVDFLNKKDVVMKPKWYFVLKGILKVVSFFVVFLIVLYFISFITLVLREQNFFLLYGMGPGKLSYFINSLPWLIVSFALVGVLVLEVLVRKFSFSYRAPVFYSFIFVIFLVFLTSFLVNKFDPRYSFPRAGENLRAPILEDMHRYYRGDRDKRPLEYKDFKKIKKELKIEFE